MNFEDLFSKESLITDDMTLSEEYMTSFKYIRNHKTFNLKSIEGMNLHVFRNKNQFKKAPKDLDTMTRFVENGYYIYEGFSPCHNITPSQDSPKMRKEMTKLTAKLYAKKELRGPNRYAPLNNISYRGTPGTDFEGCQFVYNYDNGLLVSDNTNRGTYDYGMFGKPAHFFLDILPWIKVGNGSNIETVDMFIMPENVERKYLNTRVHFNKKTMNDVEKIDNSLVNKFVNTLSGEDFDEY